MTQFITRELASHLAVELPADVAVTPAHLADLQELLSRYVDSGSKVVISLPPNFQTGQQPLRAFAEFAGAHFANRLVLVPPEALELGWGWKAVVLAGLAIASRSRALAWATADKMRPGAVIPALLGRMMYLKCSGDATQAITQLVAAITNVLSCVSVQEKILERPKLVNSPYGTLWSVIHDGLIFDLADLCFVDRKFVSQLKKVLHEHGIRPDQPGIYFVTCDHLQSWVLQQRLQVSHREVANIIRLVSGAASGSQPNAEVNVLTSHCHTIDAPPNLFFHLVKPEVAAEAIAFFSPDLVLAEEQHGARLSSWVPADRIQLLIPANEAGVGMLAPGRLTDGFPVKYFGEYIVSRYRNHRGHPNDTYICYMDAQPAAVKKGIDDFVARFSAFLTPQQRSVLDKLRECDSEEGFQAVILLSSFNHKALRFEVSFPFASKGGETFLDLYPELFPGHYAVLCKALRLFVKANPEIYVETRLDMLDEVSEWVVRKSSFWLELRIHNNKSSLVLKSATSDELQHQCFRLFSFLAGSKQLFRQLSDQEILIEIISLLWDNSRIKSDTSQGLQITLLTSPNRSKLTLYQRPDNRLVLRAGEHGELPSLSCAGQFLYDAGTQKHLFKLAHYFFPAQDNQNAWAVACCEAIHQVAANAEGEQIIRIHWSIEGGDWLAAVSSNALAENRIGEPARRTMEKGAPQVQIAATGREIKLAQNITGASAEPGEIDAVEPDSMLLEIEQEKQQEQSQHTIRVQNIYEEALQQYKKQHGFAEERLTEFQDSAAADMPRLPATIGGQRMRAYVWRVIWGALGLLALGMFVFVLLLSESLLPSPQRRTAPVETPPPSISAAVLTCQLRVSSPHRLELSGAAPSADVRVKIKDEQGLTIHERVVPVQNGRYLLALDLPAVPSCWVHITTAAAAAIREHVVFAAPSQSGQKR